MTLLVDIAVGSRFHAFDLARMLAGHGALGTLHTGYPAFSGPSFGVPRRNVSSVWTHEPANRLCAQLHRRGILSQRLDATLSERFDRVVAKRIRRGANVFVGWASQCLASLHAAKALGMVTFVERGSCHILWQRAVLEQEQRDRGMCAELPQDKTVERELAEYAVADFIAVPSRFAARTFLEQGVPRHKIVINPYGVDIDAFRPTAPKLHHETSHGLRVLHVGRVSLQKGVQYLVPAVGALPSASLSLVGGVDPGMAGLTSPPFVTAYGAVPRHALPAHYAKADVFCLLSIQEGWGLVVAQAMAMGLPVITTENTGAAEMVTEGVEGFVVSARDSVAVTERLRYLASNPEERRLMGLRARERILREYSWSAYGDRAMRVYRDRLNGTKESGCLDAS